jgi:hypothetical protein
MQMSGTKFWWWASLFASLAVASAGATALVYGDHLLALSYFGISALGFSWVWFKETRKG